MKEEANLKEEAKKISIKDGSYYSVMDGAGLRYITPYALSLGASNNLIGLLATLPPLLGNFLKLVFNRIYQRNSRKKTVVFWASMQALFWIPMILTGFLYFVFNLSVLYSSILLVISYSGIMISGALSSPAWSSWMQDVVQKERGKYFSKRSRVNGFVALSTMFIAGFILDYFKNGQVFYGFLILFSIAAIGRCISVSYLKKQYEPKFEFEEKSYFSFFRFLKKMASNNFGRFVIFVSLISFSVAIASPFFSVYMIKELHFSYVAFTIITMSSSISTLIFLPLWGKWSDRFGNVIVFRLCAIFISAVPLLWFVSAFLNLKFIFLMIFLFLVEAFSGFVWAGFNLSTSNFIYDAVTRQKLALCLTYFSFINSAGSLIGATLGGILSNAQNFTLLGTSAILSLFLVSGVLRFIPSIIVGIKLKEVKKVEIPEFHLMQINLRKV
jgi:MFS family permease